MEKQSIVKKAHAVTLKEEATITGITQVVSVTDKEVVLAVGDRRLTLTGSGFSADKLSLEEGVIVVKGEVSQLKYSAAAEGKSLIKRLFK